MQKKAGWLLNLVAAAVYLVMAQTGWAWHFDGVVWYDTNRNGIYDTNEAGVSNITVQVRTCSNNSLVASTSTASDGTFAFSDSVVPLNTNYQVFFQLPSGYVFTQQIYPPPTNGTIVSTVNPATGYAPCFDFDQLSNNTLNNAGIVPQCAPEESCISSNFNSTAIASNSYVWFNSAINVSGRNGAPATILVNNATVNFTVNGSAVSVGLPPAIIQFQTNATTASTTYNTCMDTWVATIPASYTNNVFLSGLGYQLPTNYPGGIKSVTWCADFSSDLAGLATAWKWGAAVYTNFNPNLDALGVKPIDGATLNPYTNTDAAGTPENFKQFVTGGAGGNGGTNYTGFFPITNTLYLCDYLTNASTLVIKTNTTATALTSLTVCPGNPAAFTTTAAGTGPFSYVWTKNGTVLAGQTNNVFSIPSAAASNAATYAVIVTGSCNSVTNSAVLTVNSPVTATGPANLTVNPGSNATFTVTAGGTGPFSYLWSFNGAPLAGQTSSSLTINSVASTNAGTYGVIVGGDCTSVTNRATLAVNTPTSATFGGVTNLAVCPGNGASFAVSASGTGPFTYAWSKGGAVLTGQTNSTISIPSVTATNAGVYTVVVTGVVNSVTNSLSLTVNTNTTITPLANLVVNPGNNATFSTVASGTGPFTYTWSFNSGVLAGQTGSSLTISSVSSNNAGIYSVLVNGDCNSANSSATLTVNTPTTAIFSSATNQAVCPGSPATFAVTAAGTGPFTYVWNYGGGVLSGQTNNTFTLPSVTATNAGLYTVIVTGAANSVTNSVTLVVNTNTTITPLASLVENPGQTATFSTVANGTGPFSYVWSFNGTVLASQTNSSLTISSVSSNSAGVYNVAVNGDCNSVNSSATLTVNVPTTAILSLVNGPAVCPGNSATFSVVAAGTGPFSYVWSYGGGVLSGQTNSTFTLPSVTATNAGLYTVIVTGAANSVTNSAALVVNTNTTITPLVNLVENPGQAATFSTVASGTGPFTYVWSFNGSVMAGQTNSSLTISSVSSNNAGVYNVAVNGDCNGTNSSATLTVNVPTTAILSLVNGPAVCPGSSATFMVVAAGTGPFSYVWSYGGGVLSGQTNNTFTLPSVTAANAGLYTVIVTGAANSVTNSATLVVNTNTTITPLASLVENPGQAATFSTVASGTGPFSYVWSFNGSVLATQTNSSLTISSVNSNNAGVYNVAVNGDCNSTNSSATLTVNVPTTAILSLVNGPAVCPGNSATFMVVAAGTGPFSYVWSYGGGVLSGQTNSTFTLPSVTATNAGPYTVIVTGAANSVTNSAALTVNVPTTAVGPGNIVANPGDNITFTTMPGGTGPFTYEWSFAGAPLAGQTSSNLTISAVSSNNAGIYSVVVGGTCNTVTNSATLSVNAPTTATLSFSSLALCPGNNGTLMTLASGTGPFTYVWTKNGTVLTGQTNDDLILPSVSAADAGVYVVVVTGKVNSVTNAATVTINVPTTATALVPLAVCPGNSATFSMVASGTGPFTYAWTKDGMMLTGQTNNTLTIASAGPGDAGQYSVTVDGTCNTATSTAALTVNSITTASPLTPLVKNPGDNATFSTAAGGTGPFTYQWSYNGSILAGQTNGSLTISLVSSNNAGIYAVAVTGNCNSVTNSATLAVNTPTSATLQTSSLVLCPGDSATLETVPVGSGPFSYIWSLNGTALPGQTNGSIIIPLVGATNAGLYSVVVTGAANSVTNSATLTVNTPTSITALSPVTVCPGSGATFSTVASGTGPFNYVWTKNGALLASQTSSALVLDSVGAGDAGLYAVAVSGNCNTATSSASLTVNSITAAIGPNNLTQNPGDTAIFSTAPSGSGPFTYQWGFNGQPLVGQTNETLTISQVISNNAGPYTVIVNGACNSVTNTANLTVNTPTSVTIPSANQSLCPGNSGTLTAMAAGTGPFTYTWSFNGSVVPGQTGSSFTIPAANAADAGVYTVVVTGAANSVTNSAILTVNSFTTATAPVSLVDNPGQVATFTTVPGGTGPFSYEWSFNGALLPAQTNASITINPVEATNAGVYSVVVNGTCNSVTNSATLTVNVPTTTIFSTPSNQTTCPDESVTFGVTASGTGPFSYQWGFDGSPLASQTNDTLIVSSVTSSNAGAYTVVVTGVVNSVTNNATLTVNSVTTATPLASQIINAGNSATFSTVASGTGPFTYAWKFNGSPIGGQTGSSLTIPSVSSNSVGAYSVTVNGACGSAGSSATLSLAVPPSVAIVNPTNGAVFIALANITILADALDVDATVTNVQFFVSGTNQIGQATTSPYFIVWTNVTPGTYTLTARATDSLGASAVSAPVTISVLDEPPLVAVGPSVFNPQIDVVEQTYSVSNQTYYSYDGVRVVISNVVNGVEVYNATGTTNGLPYVQDITPLPPGGTVQFTIEYYTPTRTLPTNVVYLVQLVGALNVTSPAGSVVPLTRGTFLSDKTFLVEFNTESNRVYDVEYSSNLFNWQTAMPAVTGTGVLLDWIDNGPPGTASPPFNQPKRFYRVILLP